LKESEETSLFGADISAISNQDANKDLLLLLNQLQNKPKAKISLKINMIMKLIYIKEK